MIILAFCGLSGQLVQTMPWCPGYRDSIVHFYYLHYIISVCSLSPNKLIDWLIIDRGEEGVRARCTPWIRHWHWQVQLCNATLLSDSQSHYLSFDCFSKLVASAFLFFFQYRTFSAVVHHTPLRTLGNIWDKNDGMLRRQIKRRTAHHFSRL